MDTVKLVHSLIPELSLASHSARVIWRQNETRAFLFVVRVLLAFGMVGYILHYHLVDLNLSKSGDLWFYYRYGMATLYAVVFAIYFWRPLQQARWFWLPWFLVGQLSALLQAQTVVWAKDVPNYEPIIAIIASLAFAAIVAVSLRKNIPMTICIAGATMYAQWPALAAGGYQQGYLMSLAILSLIFAIMSRAKMASDISALISNVNAMDAERQAIESQIELYEQTKALLPREIFRRIRRFQQTQRMSAMMAMNEVLRPRHRRIVCIYSDIRSYTRRSKSETDFVMKGVLPNTKTCTEVVEDYRGIPRLIGDLILTYFDQEDVELNMKLALKAAKGMVEASREQNTLLAEFIAVERYVVVTFGQAVVGNLGGPESSFEITCMGDPVNLGSRIDELTKKPEIKPYLRDTCIVLSRDAAHIAALVMPGLEIKSLDLKTLGLSIRDYQEENEVCLVYLSQHNIDIIEESAYREYSAIPMKSMPQEAAISSEIEKAALDMDTFTSGHMAHKTGLQIG